MKITGYYNEYGYQIKTDNPLDCLLYRAGNHALESQQDGTGTKHQLSLEIIKSYCEQTSKEIANEKHAEFIGM